MAINQSSGPALTAQSAMSALDAQNAAPAPSAGSPVNFVEPASIDNKPDLFQEVLDNNILDHFRSYNCLFTLSALPASVFRYVNTDVYDRKIAEYKSKYVIASSIGKGQSTIKSPGGPSDEMITGAMTAETESARLEAEASIDQANKTDSYITSFNKSSEGRFDFYFDDVRIESQLTSNTKSGFTRLNSLQFNLIEPYGLGAFFEALQAAALAAGYADYKAAHYLFTVEFIGYPDWEGNTQATLGQPVKIEPATRYYSIGFGEVGVKADVNGTKYECKAFPMGDLALGNPNTLKTNINISGNTVYEILKNFMESLNKIEYENHHKDKYTGSPTFSKQNVYDVKFPVRDEEGYLDFDDKNIFAGLSNKVADLSKDNIAYDFKDPTEVKPGRVRYIPSEASVQFHAGSNIHDCITAIVRDCDETKKIFSDFNNKIDAMGLIDYFMIGMDSVPSPTINPQTSLPFYKYTYYIIPYKIHHSRMPGLEDTLLPISPELVNRRVRRKYQYLYTGKNSHILNFNIKYDNLFYQIDPFRDGGQPALVDDKNRSGVGDPVPLYRKNTELSDSEQKAINAVRDKNLALPITSLQNPDMTRILNAGESTRPLQASPHANFVKALHAALLDNTGMKMIDLDIIGDPFYIMQSGIGNLKPKTLKTKDNQIIEGITETGALDHLLGDSYILLEFKSPKDLQPLNGPIEWSNVTHFSGVYRINKILSVFNDGLFKQTLNCTLMHSPYDPEYSGNVIPELQWVPIEQPKQKG